MVDFANSQTRENLMRAFAGESQARNRYTFAAGLANAQRQYVLERIFLFTAGQEKEHAEIFYNHLVPCAGENIAIDGTYPIDIATDMAELLNMARHNETEEAVNVYPAFANVARQEGFEAIARTFEMIAQIENTHALRFACYMQYVKDGTLYRAAQEQAWMCLNCGHILTGMQAPNVCPVCRHEQGYFIRVQEAPYTSQ